MDRGFVGALVARRQHGPVLTAATARRTWFRQRVDTRGRLGSWFEGPQVELDVWPLSLFSSLLYH
jgi:hypothetical protein